MRPLPKFASLSLVSNVVASSFISLGGILLSTSLPLTGNTSKTLQNSTRFYLLLLSRSDMSLNESCRNARLSSSKFCMIFWKSHRLKLEKISRWHWEPFPAKRINFFNDSMRLLWSF